MYTKCKVISNNIGTLLKREGKGIIGRDPQIMSVHLTDLSKDCTWTVMRLVGSVEDKD